LSNTVYFPPFREYPGDPGLASTVSVSAKGFAFFEGRLAASVKTAGDEMPIREYDKVVQVTFDSPVNKLSATKRKNWQLVDDAGHAIIPGSVSAVSDRSVVLSVPSIEAARMYTIYYTIKDSSNVDVRGSIEVRGI